MASDLDIITFEEAIQAANLQGNTQHVARLEAMVTGISGTIDRLCGPVVAREVTEKLTGGRCSLLIGTTPVYELGDVVETTGTSPATLTTDDYELEASGHYAVLHRRTGGYDTSWAYGARNISVTFTAGRYATTDDVDEYWKAGAKSILALRWSWEAPQWARNPQGDEFRPDGPFDTLAAVQAQFPLDLLPPGIA